MWVRDIDRNIFFSFLKSFCFNKTLRVWDWVQFMSCLWRKRDKVTFSAPCLQYFYFSICSHILQDEGRSAGRQGQEAWIKGTTEFRVYTLTEEDMDNGIRCCNWIEIFISDCGNNCWNLFSFTPSVYHVSPWDMTEKYELFLVHSAPFFAPPRRLSLKWVMSRILGRLYPKIFGILSLIPLSLSLLFLSFLQSSSLSFSPDLFLNMEGWMIRPRLLHWTCSRHHWICGIYVRPCGLLCVRRIAPILFP